MGVWQQLTFVGLACLVFLFGKCNAQNIGGTDERCRCVCPKISTIFPDLNDTNTRTVYIKHGGDARDCWCPFVLDEIFKREGHLEGKFDVDTFCLRCSCKFEKRNSTTQKVVIIIVMATMAALFVYGLFLMILDPLLNRRPNRYRPQTDDLMSGPVEIPADHVVRPGRVMRSSSVVTDVVNRVQNTQARWKSNVRVQRDNIFSRHTMLN